MEIINYKPEELKPYENNPRKNDIAVDSVANSIKEFGFKVPIVIDSNKEIVCGHTRLKAAIKLGLQTVPCIMADDLSEEQIRAFRLADNKTAELSGWDFTKLDEELAKIDNLDMDKFGFNFDDFDKDDISDFISESDAGGRDKDKPVTCPHCGTTFDVNTLEVFKEAEE